MKSPIWKRVTMLALLGALAVPVSGIAQSTTHYIVVNLDGLGGTAGGGNSINDRGWVTGSANIPGDNVAHAALWLGGSKPVDLGALGGNNANSTVAWPVKNNNGVIVGISDTATDNPLGEAFSCWPFFAPGSPTRRTCQGFRWEGGTMTALPAFPGGYNSYATAANNQGQTVGWAENGVHDPTCNPAFQVLQFRAVMWGSNGQMQELPPIDGDSTSAATAMNDLGQVVGISGACGIAVGSVSAAHALLWDNGVPTDIGSLGGHMWNTPTAINNQGVVAGFSLLAGQDGTRNYEAFVWTKDGGMHSLGKPLGDIRSAAFGINHKGQIVGLSRGGAFVFRALIWENGVMTDLNTLVPAGSPFLLYANDINDRGEITGQACVVVDGACTTTNAVRLIPVHVSDAEGADNGGRPQKVTVPDSLRQQIERRLGLGFE